MTNRGALRLSIIDKICGFKGGTSLEGDLV